MSSIVMNMLRGSFAEMKVDETKVEVRRMPFDPGGVNNKSQ